MPKFKALDIAHWFINYSNTSIDFEEPITLLKVLKLLYYAEGCNLALLGDSLFDDKLVAWEHGPVVVEVYDAYEDPYNLDLTEEEMVGLSKIEPQTEDLLNRYLAFLGNTPHGLCVIKHILNLLGYGLLRMVQS